MPAPTIPTRLIICSDLCVWDVVSGTDAGPMRGVLSVLIRRRVSSQPDCLVHYYSRGGISRANRVPGRFMSIRSAVLALRQLLARGPAAGAQRLALPRGQGVTPLNAREHLPPGHRQHAGLAARPHAG